MEVVPINEGIMSTADYYSPLLGRYREGWVRWAEGLSLRMESSQTLFPVCTELPEGCPPFPIT